MLEDERAQTFASYAFGVPIPIDQPEVGANAFAHELGIHADGVLKGPHNSLSMNKMIS